MQVTVQNVSGGSGRSIASSASGRGVDPARDAEDEVDPHRRLEDPLLEPAHGADHVADVEALDLERDPRIASPARRSRARPAAA